MESYIVQKMMKRIDALEQELREVQTKLNEAIQTIGEKDKELEKLKIQILEANKQRPDREPKETDYKTNVKNQGPSNYREHPFFTLNSDDIPYERRLSESVDSRIRKISALIGEDIPGKTKSDSSKPKKKHDRHSNRNKKKSKQDYSHSSMEVIDVNCETVHDNSVECIDNSTFSDSIEEEYTRLAGQLAEIEEFLGDYGLIWVGDVNISKEDIRKVHAGVGFTPNFDKLILIIGELNERTASESHINVSENKIGTFKKADILKLAFYADGIQLEDNPFREYSTESVKEFFQDLEDGYYPTELKETYPDGVIFKVIDLRDKTFDECHENKHFSGKGYRLGMGEMPSADSHVFYEKSFNKCLSEKSSLNPNIRSQQNLCNEDLSEIQKSGLVKANTSTVNMTKISKENINISYVDPEDHTNC